MIRSVLVVGALVTATMFGSGTAAAVELGDYQWDRRPLLVFAPTDDDARLAETLTRIEADRCGFASRDMVLGQVVTEGTSTLDGQVIDVDQAHRTAAQYGVDDSAFVVLLIGKDGEEKLRVNTVPDLRAVYAVVDGMPMRQREAGTDSC